MFGAAQTSPECRRGANTQHQLYHRGEGKISVAGEHILHCDVDLVSSPSLRGLCFLC